MTAAAKKAGSRDPRRSSASSNARVSRRPESAWIASIGAVSAAAPKTRWANESCSSRSRRRRGSPLPILVASHATSTRGEARIASACRPAFPSNTATQNARDTGGARPPSSDSLTSRSTRAASASGRVKAPRPIRHQAPPPRRQSTAPAAARPGRRRDRPAGRVRGVAAPDRAAPQSRTGMRAAPRCARQLQQEARGCFRALSDESLPGRLGLGAPRNRHGPALHGKAGAERGEDVCVAALDPAQGVRLQGERRERLLVEACQAAVKQRRAPVREDRERQTVIGQPLAVPQQSAPERGGERQGHRCSARRRLARIRFGGAAGVLAPQPVAPPARSRRVRATDGSPDSRRAARARTEAPPSTGSACHCRLPSSARAHTAPMSATPISHDGWATGRTWPAF